MLTEVSVRIFRIIQCFFIITSAKKSETPEHFAPELKVRDAISHKVNFAENNVGCLTYTKIKATTKFVFRLLKK